MLTQEEETALDLLHSRDFIAARNQAVQALRCAPQSSRIKALIFRINSEDALDKRNLEAAEREFGRAVSLDPEDPALFLLGEKIRVRRSIQARGTQQHRRGILATLFGRRATMPA